MEEKELGLVRIRDFGWGLRSEPEVPMTKPWWYPNAWPTDSEPLRAGPSSVHCASYVHNT